MTPNTSIKLFTGPSLTPASKKEAETLGIEIISPIQRGDIPRLLAEGFHGTIIIADGLFYRKIPVGHMEIRDAMEAGIKVYGLSSMGAIRAYEMRNLGMIGYGKVYNYFLTMDDFQDDELALLHAPIPPYFSLSEPLVHFRYCLDQLLLTKAIHPKTRTHILKVLKNTRFGQRTINKFLLLLDEQGYSNSEALKNDFDKYRIKQQDLLDFLKDLPEDIH